ALAVAALAPAVRAGQPGMRHFGDLFRAQAPGEEEPAVQEEPEAGRKPGAERGPAPEEGKKKKKAEQGWAGFSNVEFIVDTVVALVLSTVLAGAIAYHPKTYGKATTLEEVDQPKIFIMYGVVGAVIATIVNYYSIMAAVVFGIGGLLRFRTDVGPAKDTGRVILVTLIGIACGLKVYVFVILATAYAWGLIWLLESRVTHRLVVKGLETSLLAKAAEAYEEVLLENGLRIMSQKKNFVKGQVAFVFRAPGELDREELESLFKDIPPKLQGAVDWESS
ncbi:MAG: hypothetical protein ACUVYA_20815, partial [Planctomycetota bacterium]